MSRNYEVQVEVFPCPSNDGSHVSDVLAKWGMEIDNDVETYDNEHGDGWCFWGSIQLSLGQTLEQQHNKLRALLPDRALITRWRYVDDLPWDDVIESDPGRSDHQEQPDQGWRS